MTGIPMDNSKIGAAHLTKSREYLGRGINIFDQAFLDPPSRSPAINVTEAMISTIPLGRTGLSETYGKSFAEFIQKFSVGAGMQGSYKGFTGSVETKYATSSRESVDTQYMELALVSSGAILSINSDPVVLKTHLNADFKKALAEAEPKTLFRNYGTHVAVALKLGGMLSYYVYSKATEHQSESEFKAAATAKYEGYGADVGANGETSEEQKRLAKTVEGSENLFVNGGGEEERIKIEKNSKDSYAAWAKSLSAQPGFVGFQPNGLVAVWELTDDAARRQALELAFKQEAARQFQIRIFTHTGKRAAHPEARVSIPEEYKLLAGGARDNFTGGGNLLTASFPDGDSAWIARGKDHVSPDQATMSVFAIGIYDNLDVWEVAQASAPSKEEAHPSAEVAVPGGFVLVGGGARVVNKQNADKLLTSSYPKTATTWQANATDPENDNLAAITVFAQGLRCKIEGVKIEIDINHVQSVHAAHPSEKCSPDRAFTLTGGGAFVNYGTGRGNLLISSYPENDRTWATSSKDHIKHSQATLTAYAIGLKVS